MRAFDAIIILSLAAGLPRAASAGVESTEVTLDYVAKKAEQRARKPFRPPRIDLPDELKPDKLDYDKYREIEFRHEKALWAAEDLPFRVEFFHPGYLYQDPVHINEFTVSHVQPIRFVQDFFNYRSLHIQSQIPADTGYAGFRVLYPLNHPETFDELGAFLGASYFRLLGKGQRYGQSARGLALDCGEKDRPEEFPMFTDWWLGKPQKSEEQLRLYAILDSVSCTGAYAFLIRPGETTSAEIEAILFFREQNSVQPTGPQWKTFKTVGLAPLTSMFWFGDGSERRFPDYRRAVHDTDGLLVRTENGETIWRPLTNPVDLRHQRFAAPNLRGFGLMQRDRNFADYQDLFNLYQQVPSVWVEPRGHWGEGEVNLVELNGQQEGVDNIVAFWDPKEKPQPMQPYRLAYTLYWTGDGNLRMSPNRVLATRIGIDPRDTQCRQFAIDFGGPKLSALPANAPPQVISNCGTNAALADTQVFHNPFNNSWRVMLKLQPKAGNKEPVELSCKLKKGEEVLTETWTYLWSPGS